MNPYAADTLSRNGRLLARVTGWRRRRLTVSAALGPETCYNLPSADLLAVMRPNAALRCVLYGAPDAWGRRQIVARKAALCDGIRYGLRLAEGAGKLDNAGAVC